MSARSPGERFSCSCGLIGRFAPRDAGAGDRRLCVGFAAAERSFYALTAKLDSAAVTYFMGQRLARDVVLGTLIGTGPEILRTVSFVYQPAASLRYPTPGSFAVSIGIGATLVAISIVSQRFIGRKECAAEDERQRKRDAQPLRERVVHVKGTRQRMCERPAK